MQAFSGSQMFGEIAAAIEADPTLLDRDASAEQAYLLRYGEDQWRATVRRCCKNGTILPWLRTENEKERRKIERQRVKAEKAAAKAAE